MLETLRALPAYWKTFVRSALIGSWMGIGPAGPPRLVYELRHCPNSRKPQKSLALVCWKACSPRNCCPCGWRVGVAPDDYPGHSGLSDCRDARRPPHLGPAAWANAFQERPDFVWGHCQHVYGECHRRPHCPALRPGLCRHPQDALCHLDPRHCLRLCHWCLCGQQQHHGYLYA